jgi:hypothetical protein
MGLNNVHTFIYMGVCTVSCVHIPIGVESELQQVK